MSKGKRLLILTAVLVLMVCAYLAVTKLLPEESSVPENTTVTALQLDEDSITGISWGGITTTIVMGIDYRFKFAAPVYGCGFLYQCQTYFKNVFRMFELILPSFQSKNDKLSISLELYLQFKYFFLLLIYSSQSNS